MLGLSGSIPFFIVVVLCSYNSKASAATGGVSEFLKNTFKGENNVLHEKTAGLYRFFGSNLHPNKVNLVKDCNYNDPDKIQFCPPALNPKNFVFPNGAANNNDENKNKVIPTKCFETEEEEESNNKNDPECSHFRYVTNENGKESRLLPTTAPVAVTEAVFHQSRLSSPTTNNDDETDECVTV